jgi:hypothetical protein
MHCTHRRATNINRSKDYYYLSEYSNACITDLHEILLLLLHYNNYYYYCRTAQATPESADDSHFASTRPVGHASAGQLFALASPLAATSYAPVPAESYLHDRPEEGGAQLTTVLEDGSRFFLRARRGQGDDAESSITKRIPAAGSLLSLSMKSLSIEADRLQRHVLTSKRAAAARALEPHAPLLANENSLWVDKYAPRLFSQLLSSEKSNREILKALKQWDPFVFGAKLGQTQAPQYGRQVRGDSRPLVKVILLCGPPGTGKVCCAIAAMLCYAMLSLCYAMLLLLLCYCCYCCYYAVTLRL